MSSKSLSTRQIECLPPHNDHGLCSHYFLGSGQTHAELRKWIGENVGAEVAAAVRIQYGGMRTRGKLNRRRRCDVVF